jgi:hypothetical protein
LSPEPGMCPSSLWYSPHMFLVVPTDDTSALL